MSDPVMEDRSMNVKKHPELAKSDIIKHLPKACGDEKAAVEFFERQRWGNSPVCPHCQSADVYKMRAALAGGINAISGAAVRVVNNTRFAQVRFTKIQNCRCGIGRMVSGAFAPARRA